MSSFQSSSLIFGAASKVWEKIEEKFLTHIRGWLISSAAWDHHYGRFLAPASPAKWTTSTDESYYHENMAVLLHLPSQVVRLLHRFGGRWGSWTEPWWLPPAAAWSSPALKHLGLQTSARPQRSFHWSHSRYRDPQLQSDLYPVEVRP